MQKDKIKIAAVSYLNTLPFIWGIEHSGILQKIELQRDYPSQCAASLISGQVDAGLIPVAAIKGLTVYKIFSGFCIGAVTKVRTVELFSNSPLQEIRTIFLDYQSRTSVNLVKILVNNFWKLNVEYQPANEGFSFEKTKMEQAVLVIGDRAFRLENQFKYKYDLAEEWIRFTGLPFVFAAWIAVKPLHPDFISEFNQALKTGIESIDLAVESLINPVISKQEAKDYLNHNLSYNFDKKKFDGMNLFLSMIPDNS